MKIFIALCALTISLALPLSTGFAFFMSEEDAKKQKEEEKLRPKIIYTYKDRDHTLKESIKYASAIYGISWLGYFLSQPEAFTKNGSMDKYQKNLGRLVFDKDEPVWNWMVHPYTGSQMFLFYRANGYSQWGAFAMTAIQSALFEFTVEVYTEPASIQDLYQTPVFGAILGTVLEKTSLALLNSDNALGEILGHLLNPSTLFWFYEGRVEVYPTITGKNEGKLSLTIHF